MAPCQGHNLWLAQWCATGAGASRENPKLVWHPTRGTPSWLAQWCAIGAGASRGTLSWCGTLQGAYSLGLLNGVQWELAPPGETLSRSGTPPGAQLLACSMVCNRSWHLPGNPKLVWYPARGTLSWLSQWCAIGAGASRGTLR